MKVPGAKPTSNEPEVQKQQWGGHLEFILTCVGYSVGLGNVWRFPYLTYRNGGGAFLIPYFIMLVMIGYPLYLLELAFGQFSSQGPFSAWKVNPLMKGLGFAATIVCAYITTYFNVIIAWSMYFFISSFTRTLPWTSCSNDWNTPDCVASYENLTSNHTYTTPSEEFFYNHVLHISEDIGHLGPVSWQLCIMLLVAWIICFLVLIKGIQSLGKAAYVTSTFPYLLLLCVLVRGATLTGAGEGVKFYITPQWSKLATLKVWGNAASQIFYSTGCGQSALIAMASYNRFKNNAYRDSILIPTIETATSLYAGFVIFSLLGYMAHVKGVHVGEVATQGPGLVFIVYPEGLATMPIPQLWSAMFFLMMIMIGFSSQFSQCEAIISSFLDEFPFLRIGKRSMLLRLAFCIISFLLGLPMITRGGFYVFEVLDTYGAGYTLLFVAFGEIVALNWVYGFNNWAEDLAMMTGRRPNIYFRVTWTIISPAVIVAVLLFLTTKEDGLEFEGTPYPPRMMALAWLIVALPIVVIIANMVIQFLWRGGWTLCKEVCQPLPEWGPLLPENRTGRYAKLNVDSKDPKWREDEVEMTTQDNWGSKNGADNKDMQDNDPKVTQPLYPQNVV